MRVLGLTGGIGTGKSEVAAMLQAAGAKVIDADREGHLTYARGSMGWRRLVELFGDSVLGDDEEIDRRTLGRLVFSNPQAMAWLNAAIHPLIRERLIARLAEMRDEGTEVAVVDAAVLYEAGWDDLTDEVWLVKADPGTVIPRLAEQRGLDAAEARRRIEAQVRVHQAADRADVVIENAGTLQELRDKVERLWKARILPLRHQRT